MKKLIIFCDYFGNGGIEKIVTYINKNIDKTSFQVKYYVQLKIHKFLMMRYVVYLIKNIEIQYIDS